MLALYQVLALVVASGHYWAVLANPAKFLTRVTQFFAIHRIVNWVMSIRWLVAWRSL